MPTYNAIEFWTRGHETNPNMTQAIEEVLTQVQNTLFPVEAAESTAKTAPEMLAELQRWLAARVPPADPIGGYGLLIENPEPMPKPDDNGHTDEVSLHFYGAKDAHDERVIYCAYRATLRQMCYELGAGYEGFLEEDPLPSDMRAMLKARVEDLKRALQREGERVTSLTKRVGELGAERNQGEAFRKRVSKELFELGHSLSDYVEATLDAVIAAHLTHREKDGALNVLKHVVAVKVNRIFWLATATTFTDFDVPF